GLVGMSALLGVGNPERYLCRGHSPNQTIPKKKQPTRTATAARPRSRVHVTACLTHWPANPGEQLFLRRLKQFSYLNCFLLEPGPAESVDNVQPPDTLQQTRPELVRRPGMLRRLMDWLRRPSIPAPRRPAAFVMMLPLLAVRWGLVGLLEWMAGPQKP